MGVFDIQSRDWSGTCLINVDFGLVSKTVVKLRVVRGYENGFKLCLVCYGFFGRCVYFRVDFDMGECFTIQIRSDIDLLLLFMYVSLVPIRAFRRLQSAF